MKRAALVFMPILLIAATARSQQTNNNNVQNNQSQNASAVGGGNADSISTSIVGDNTASAQGGSSVSYSNAISEGGTGVGWSNSVSEGGIGWSDSNASVNINTTSTTNVKNRTPPLGAYPPYLPLWNHGGWGTVNAYFPNGPTSSDSAYQRTFDTSSEEEMRELRRILTSLPYASPMDMLGGVLNGIVALFGGPDNYHRGRGFEIANSLVRDRRPSGKPLIVFIDSYIDPQLLREAGYAYVGRLSLEGDTDRNWDHVYNAALAETLPWDVDILLLSGGMKGVTVGSNMSFPTASLGYSQVNYSLSLLGGKATGITEGKGEAVISASAYRYNPSLIQKRRIPEGLFERIRRPLPVAAAQAMPTQTGAPAATAAPAAQARPTAPQAAPAKGPGIEVSKKLYDMAGYSGSVDHVTVK